MAITVNHKINSALRSVQVSKGLKVKHLRFVVGATTDYVVGTGFLLAGFAGFKNVWGIGGVTLRTTANVIKPCTVFFDHATQGLRFFEAAPLPAAADEFEQADFAANDIVDVVVFGI